MGKKQRIDQNDISKIAELENRLQQYFIPIPPRPDFISTLRKRLLQISIPVDPLSGSVRNSLLIFAGLVGGILLIVTGLRILIAIFSVLAAARYLKNRAGGNSVRQGLSV